MNVEKKNDAGSSGCEHAPEQAGTPSAAVTPPRMDAGAIRGGELRETQLDEGDDVGSF